MIFNATNSNKAKVFDVDTECEIKSVTEVDTLENTLLVLSQPLEIVHGVLVSNLIRYQKIHPIYAGSPTPQLFHCYGRIYEN